MLWKIFVRDRCSDVLNLKTVSVINFRVVRLENDKLNKFKIDQMDYIVQGEFRL